jgi:hypothetical protein
MRHAKSEKIVTDWRNGYWQGSELFSALLLIGLGVWLLAS